MSSRRDLPGFLGLALFAATLSAALGACDDWRPLPSGPDVAAVPDLSDGPAFYYHQGEPVYLEVDLTRIVIAARVPSGGTVAAELLRGAGIGVLSADPLSQEPDHWLLRLPAGTAPSVALQAVQQLRGDARFRFAAHAYKTVEGSWDVVLLN